MSLKDSIKNAITTFQSKENFKRRNEQKEFETTYKKLLNEIDEKIISFAKNGKTELKYKFEPPISLEYFNKLQAYYYKENVRTTINSKTLDAISEIWLRWPM